MKLHFRHNGATYSCEELPATQNHGATAEKEICVKASNGAQYFFAGYKTQGTKKELYTQTSGSSSTTHYYVDNSNPTIHFVKDGVTYHMGKRYFSEVETIKVNSVTRWAVSSPTAAVASTTTSGKNTYTYYSQSVTFTATLSCTGSPKADMSISNNGGVWSGSLTGNPDTSVSNGSALSRTVKFSQSTYGTGNANANSTLSVRDRTGGATVNSNVGSYTYTGSLLRGAVSSEE